jgi:D-alanyl-D-alanine carboxypeptidase
MVVEVLRLAKQDNQQPKDLIKSTQTNTQGLLLFASPPLRQLLTDLKQS